MVPAGKVSGTTNGLFRAVVLANSVQQLRKEVTGPEMTTADVDAIWKLAKQPNWLDHLASSLAPSIYGVLRGASIVGPCVGPC